MPVLPDRFRSTLRAALAALMLLWGVAWPAHAAEELLQPEQAFRLEATKAGADGLQLTWSIAPGYYLYRDRMAVTESPTGGRVKADLPPGIRKDDPNFGVMEVYHDAVTMKVSPAGAAALDVTWQGCADAGLCYPPQTQTIQVAGVSSATATTTPSDTRVQPQEPGTTGLWNSVSGSDTRITRWLGERSLGWTLPLFFLLGIALAFTPCVLPMLPIVSGIVVGSQAPPRRALALSTAFVLPMALTYSALGVAAALAGENLQAMLQNRWTVLALGGVYVVLALGLGMGTPLVIAGSLGSRFLPKPGPWMNRVKAALGFMLLGTAVWMVERVVSAPLALLMWGALLLSVAVTLVDAASRKTVAGADNVSSHRLATRTLAILAGLWGSAMVFGAAGGAVDPWRPLTFAAAPATGTVQTATGLRFEAIASEPELQARLAAARASGQPTLVDFYADWCVSCKAIEKEVFGDPRVQRSLAGVLLLRADVTANDLRHRELMRTHQVVGPPTVMLFDTDGRERREARLVGEFTARQFLQRQSGQATPGAADPT